MTSRRSAGSRIAAVCSAMLLALSACADDTTIPDDPVTSPSSTSTTTTQPPTTSVPTTVQREIAKPTPIRNGTRIEPDKRYRGVLFAGDVEFELESPVGWKAVAIGVNRGQFIVFEHQPKEPDSRAGVDLILWKASDPISEVADWYRQHEQIEASTEPQPTTVAGLPAVQVDVLPSPGHPSVVPVDEFGCGGLALLEDGTLEGAPCCWQVGPMACTWNRIWVVNVEGVAVSILGHAGWYHQGEDLNPDNVWQIEDFQPLLDDFINGLTFCTAETPCDD